MLQEIEENIHIKSGKSLFFRECQYKDLIKKETFSNEDMFHLFQPEFLMETPLHSLLLKYDYASFNCIADKINETLFDEFFDYENNFYINKIKLVFIFILENVHAYYLAAIEQFYSTLHNDCDTDEDDDESDEYNDETKQKLIRNIQKMQDYLKKIANYICSDQILSKHSGLITK